MKKIFIILLLICSFFVVGCNSNDSYEKIYNKAIKIAEKAYKKEGKVGEVIIEKFYGEYNGVYVLNPFLKGYDGMYRGAQGKYIVEDYIFTFGSIDDMAYAIYNDTFYRFDEAYDLRLLTLDDFKEIYEIHCNNLLFETKYAYYERYLKKIKGSTWKDVKLEMDYLSNISNFSTNNNYTIMKLSSEYITNEEINETFQVDDMKFEFKNKNDMIYVMYENKLYTLKEAYENLQFIKNKINEIYLLYFVNETN